MDGWITIGTEIDDSKFDKQLASLNKKINDEEQKKKLKLSAMTSSEQELDRQKRRVASLEEEYEKASRKAEYLQNIMNKKTKGIALTPQEFSDVSSYDAVIKRADSLGNSLDKAYDKQTRLNLKAEQAKIAYDKSASSVRDLKAQAEQIQLKKQAEDAKNLGTELKNSVSSVNTGLSNALKTVGRMILGIFSIHSAYRLLASASSTLAQYNTQYAANIEYIKFALAQSLAPVLMYIVDLAAKLVYYIGYILNAWFGINIFSNASAKAFNKMQKSASGTSKSAKEIKKTLAGFDELTVLGDSEVGTLGGGGTGVSMPSYDFSDMNKNVPSWVKWIADNKDKIISALKAILATIALFKIAKWLDKLGLFKKMVEILRTVLGKLATGVMSLFKNAKLLKNIGLVLAISGVIYAIKSLIDLINNPSWANFGKVLIGIGVTMAGIAIVIGNVGLGVSGLAVILGGTALALTEKTSAVKDAKTAMDEYNNAVKNTASAEQSYVDAVDRAEETQRKLTEAEKTNRLSGEELYQAVQNGTLDYKNMTLAQREVYKAYLDNKTAQDNVRTSSEKLTEAKQAEIKASLQNQLSLLAEQGRYDEYKKVVVDAYNNGQLSAGEARDYIERAMGGMSDASRQTFRNDLPNDIQSGLNPDRYASQGNALLAWAQDLGRQLRDALTVTVNLMVNYKKNKTAIEQAKDIVSGLGYKTGGIVNVPKYATGGIAKVPKCASGSIINLPRKRNTNRRRNCYRW